MQLICMIILNEKKKNSASEGQFFFNFLKII